MGAGCTKDHFIQDAAEAYIVYCLQKLAVKNNVALTDDVKEKHNIFVEYCELRGISKDFNNSVYKENIDLTLDGFFSDIIKKYPNQKFDFVDVEKEFRDKKLKGDFVIKFYDNSYKSISLKNYKKGFARIQLCSGTWHSFLNSFLFKSVGVGTFVDPFTGEVFQGCNREYRDNLIDKMKYSPLKDVYNLFDTVNDTIKQVYTYGENARYWNNVSLQWKRDCAIYGLNAVTTMIDALNSIPKESVKNRIIQMAGLNYDEEILLVGKGKYLCSLFNEKYAQILQRVNSKECVVEYKTNGKSVLFLLCDSKGVIVNIEIPFTLQKNGAWHLPKVKYSGTQYHEKEGINLLHGERRPKKSKEIATSINTYLNLKKAGVC
jgi:hypothetical protein